MRVPKVLHMSIDLARYHADFGSLLFSEPEPGILEIVLSNPARLNAADERMHRDLAHVWRTIDIDEAVRVVLVRGAGEHFSSGGDYAMIEHMITDEATLVRVWKEASDLVYNLINCSKPTVAAIRGVAVGAGLAVALLADISIAGRSAKILDGHTRLGVAAGDHSVIIWPLLCGLAKSRYYLLLNEPLAGEEAERIGLISRVAEDGKAYETALAIAKRLAAAAPSAVRWTKYALNNWLRIAGPTFDTSLALEFLGFTGPEVQEGVASLRQKRAPDFPKTSPV